MEKLRRAAVPLVALLWLVSFPASALGGYDIAHIVKRTCEPGGSLIVTDEWKRPQNRDRLITEPGEVIGCPPAGARDAFQIAAGPERIAGESYLCTYFSLLNGDGADTCSAADSIDRAEPLVEPLMTIRAGDSAPLALSGIVSEDVASVAIAPAAAIPPEPFMVAIGQERAARLGATRAFGYFSLTADTRSLCAEEPAQVLGRDSSGEQVAASTIHLSTRVLDSADRVPYAGSLKALCPSPGSQRAGRGSMLAEICAVLRSLLWWR